jgi:hypothetical protein
MAFSKNIKIDKGWDLFPLFIDGKFMMEDCFFLIIILRVLPVDADVGEGCV